MPFSGYIDFNECVEQNRDKKSPEGFCAWLHLRATGKWPGQRKAGKNLGEVNKMQRLEVMVDDIKKLRDGSYEVWLVPVIQGRMRENTSRKYISKQEMEIGERYDVVISGEHVKIIGVKSMDKYEIKRSMKQSIVGYEELKDVVVDYLGEIMEIITSNEQLYSRFMDLLEEHGIKQEIEEAYQENYRPW